MSNLVTDWIIAIVVCTALSILLALAQEDYRKSISKVASPAIQIQAESVK
jgi:hypothetical protein